MPDAREANQTAAPRPADAPTALMRQYLDVKARYPDAILFFRLGDFYEMFYEDAVYVAGALNLTLTSRDKGKEDPVPMCGIPYHAARGYLTRLTGWPSASRWRIRAPCAASCGGTWSGWSRPA